MKWKRLAAVLLTLTLTMSIGTTALATGVDTTNTEELTQEEKDELYKQELEKIYNEPVQSNDWTNWPEGPGTYGEAAIIMDAGTGAILYAKNINDKHYPASITKVLTALVAVENGQLSDTVNITADCVNFLQPGDSSIALKKGNVITLEECLYATLLASANEAAYAVGENVGKNAGYDYNWFIEQMNERMKELGGTNSNFTNTNGLHDENHYTTVHDMALVGKEIFKHQELLDIMQTKQYIIEESDTVEEHVFQQKHKMLQPAYKAYYKNTVGGKTGYTSDALNTLITMADNGEQQLVCVVMREQSGKSYPDTTALFEYAFKNFNRVNVADFETSEDVGEVLTDQGGGYVTLPEGVDTSSLEMEFIPDEGTIGEATLNYTYEGELVGTARVKLSDAYIEAHTAKIEAVTDEEAEEKEEEPDTFSGKLMKKVMDNFKNMSMTEKIILAAACVVLVVLVILFIRGIAIRVGRKRRGKQSGKEKSRHRKEKEIN